MTKLVGAPDAGPKTIPHVATPDLMLSLARVIDAAFNGPKSAAALTKAIGPQPHQATTGFILIVDYTPTGLCQMATTIERERAIEVLRQQIAQIEGAQMGPGITSAGNSAH